MIKNNYITTSGNRMEQDLQDINDQPELPRQSIQMIKQLDEVVSGKYKPKKLSNTVRFLAQKYVDDIARESTLAPEKRRLLHTHLYQFTKKIPWYMKDNEPVAENTKDNVKLQTSMKKQRT